MAHSSSSCLETSQISESSSSSLSSTPPPPFPSGRGGGVEMLEGRDGLLPSLASPAFLPQFPPACSGGDSVDPGSHLGAPADDACEVRGGCLVHGSCPAPFCYPLAIERERSACSRSREKQSRPKFTPETLQAENQTFSTCGVSLPRGLLPRAVSRELPGPWFQP